MGNILDLKKQEPDVPEQVGSDGTDVPFPSPAPEQELLSPYFALMDTAPERVAWQASTKPDALERRKEHFMLGALGTLAVLVGLWQGSIALILIAILTVVAWEVHHRHGHDMDIEIDKTGVRVNGHRHRFERFKSFAIQEMPDGQHHLSLKPAAVFATGVRAPLGDQDGEEVRALLSSHLLEEEHTIPISELFLKS